MKISVEFCGEESRIILVSESAAERHILGLIYTHKQLTEVVQEHNEDGYMRSYGSSPDRLKLVLKEPIEEVIENTDQGGEGK